eukprot:scaffold125466_cov35-Tisochrysis_lutea.AAC.1
MGVARGIALMRCCRHAMLPSCEVAVMRNASSIKLRCGQRRGDKTTPFLTQYQTTSPRLCLVLCEERLWVVTTKQIAALPRDACRSFEHTSGSNSEALQPHSDLPGLVVFLATAPMWM